MMKKTGKFSEGIQRFGRSMFLPIAVMAPIGMVLGITGALVQPYMIAKVPFLGIGAINTALKSLQSIANVIFDNLALLFAMGIAYGMSKNEKGIAVFSSVLSYLTLNATMNVWLKVTGTLAEESVMEQVGQGVVLGIHTLQIDVLGGIICGLLAAFAADRYYRKQLPLALAFFSGRKFVPIVSVGFSIIAGLIIPFIWQWVTSGLGELSKVLLSDYVGTFLYTTLNRLLIPFGLHHVWNALIRYTSAGGTYFIDGKEYVGVLPALNYILFKAGPASPAWSMLPKLTRFMAQNQMVETLFVIPAIGLAMYNTAFEKNKKFVKGMIITMVLTAVLGNVTEPIEFSFLFLSPPLFIVYSITRGIYAVLLYMMNTAVGYIRGTIFDFGIFGLMYPGTRWYNIIIVGALMAAVYYFMFKWAILKLNLATPGREDEVSDNNLLQNKMYDKVAELVIEGLGGKNNIVRVENCVSRLRVDLKDINVVNKEKLKESGTTGIFFPSKNHIHVVFGPHVEFVRDAVDDELKRE